MDYGRNDHTVRILKAFWLTTKVVSHFFLKKRKNLSYNYFTMRIVSKDQIKEPFRTPLGEEIYEMIGAEKEIGGTERHSLFYVVIAQGKSSMPHYHKVSEETYYILKGKGRAVIDGKEATLTAGQACLIMPPEVHQIFNDEKEDLEFLCISAPAWVREDLFEIDAGLGHKGGKEGK